MTDQTHEKLKKIKQSFRLMMNGVASRSMRDKGADYKINWGVSLPDLQQMALEYGKDYELAIELWKEDIRECKILATMLMPPEQMPAEIVDIWMEQTHSQEMVEMACFHLYQHLDYAPVLAYQWMAAEDDLHQMAAYLILARIFSRGQEPNERGINEYMDQALSAIQGPYMSVRKAAMQSMVHFAELGLVYERMAKSAMKSINLEFF